MDALRNNPEIQAQLDRMGMTFDEFMETVNKAVEWFVDTFSKAWAVVKQFFIDNMDAIFKATAKSPKHYHLYKHARKRRTRKKYRNMLLREALTCIVEGARQHGT